MKDKIIINSHCHIFNYDCLPQVFQSRYLKGFNHPTFLRVFLTFFNNWLDEDDVFDRMRKLLKIAQKESLIDVAEMLLKESRDILVDHRIIYTPLMMDFEFGMGPVSDTNKPAQKTFEEQVNETTDVSLEYPGTFLPFIAADPRRIQQCKDKKDPNDAHGIRYITDALENNGFWGVKIYPPLGYKASHINLSPLYEYCERNHTPVTAHCLLGGGYSNEQVPEQFSTEKDKRTYWREMAHPKYWRQVLDDFPELKLNLGHFGGDIYEGPLDFLWEEQNQISIEREWREAVVTLMEDFDNVYADISFHEPIFYDSQKYFADLKNYMDAEKLGKKILFGSDWWVNRVLLSETQYITHFLRLSKKHGFNESNVRSIMADNAIAFLGLDAPNSGPFQNHQNFMQRKDKRFPGWFRDSFL